MSLGASVSLGAPRAGEPRFSEERSLQQRAGDVLKPRARFCAQPEPGLGQETNPARAREGAGTVPPSVSCLALLLLCVGSLQRRWPYKRRKKQNKS